MKYPGSYIRTAAAVAFSAMMVIGCSSDSDEEAIDLSVSPFFDDFSVDTTGLSTREQLSEAGQGGIVYSDGAAIATVVSTDDERQQVRVSHGGTLDSWYAILALEPDSVASGDSRAIARLSWSGYSEIDNDNCIGDIVVAVSARLEAEGRLSYTLSGWRHTEEECNEGEPAPLFDGEDFIRITDTPPELGVSDRFEISIDRELAELTVGIDDQRFTYALPGPVFPAARPFNRAEAWADAGPATSVVRIEEVGSDHFSFDFSNPDRLFRYGLWDAGKPGQTHEIANGELRLESVSTGDQTENRLGITGNQEQFAQAQMRLSSNSRALDGGSALARVGGSMFYASETPTSDGALDQVFAVTQIVLKSDGTTAAEYCAWQSLDNSFGDDISLTNPDSETGCNLFQLVPALDQNYTMATWMDKENNRIVFSIDDEVYFQPIESAISYGENLFPMRVQSRARGNGSVAEVFVDNLRMDLSVRQ